MSFWEAIAVKTTKSSLGVAFVALTAAASCSQETQEKAASIGDQRPDRRIETLSPDEWGAWGIDLATFDQTVSPGDDFYEHVNGAWLASFELPASRSRYGAGSIAAERARSQVRFIIEDLAASPPPEETAGGKVARFYNAYLDTKSIERNSMDSLSPYLFEIRSIGDARDLVQAFAKPYFSSPFDTGVFIDWRAPDRYIPFTSIGGFGLPSRDQYLSTDETAAQLRRQYGDLLTRLLTSVEFGDPAALAQSVLALETAMAKADWAPALERDPDLTYNKLTIAEFQTMTGAFPAASYMLSAGLGEAEAILVTEVPPSQEKISGRQFSLDEKENLSLGYPAVAKIVMETDLDVWRAYLAAHFIIDNADVLPKEIEDAVFTFYGKALRGQTKQRPRAVRAARAVGDVLGDAIGAIYVQRHFPPENRQAVQEMVANIKAALRESLEEAQWMSSATRAEALAKFETLDAKIGYPETFKDYSALDVFDDALANAVAAKRFEWRLTTRRLGRAVDRSEWFYPPYRVGGYYATSFNEIVFPAAILQPPFFNETADPAVNYGSIGGIIGHELTHAFDDEGARYDGSGVLRNWWTDEDLKKFRLLGARLVEQFGAYCPLDEGKTCVNGELTLGENMADLGGVALAYRAYRRSLGGADAPVIDGYTGDQRFFMAWAQIYRFKVREEAVRVQMASDPHSPARYRVNGVVRNIDAWYDAFDVDESHALYLPPEERVRPW
ncbi:MAG: M13 family metallopeptidase [Pseudomonadota bacterium]